MPSGKRTARPDLLVLGAGPAGWSAALQGAKLGLDVEVVERDTRLGGACVRTGTLPSKTLRHTVQQLVALRRAAHLGLHSAPLRPLDRDLMGPKEAVVGDHEHTIRGFFERNGVRVRAGSAGFTAPSEVRVATSAGEETIAARHVVIATGSRPRRPENLPFDDRVVLDSDSILALDRIPGSLAVIGGGVIGCEYACMFAALGVRVTLLDRREHLLRFLDRDLHEALAHAMRRAGIRLLLGEVLESVRVEDARRGANAIVALESGRIVRAERLLVAAGRESNVDALGLERAGVEADARGLVKVDGFGLTTAPGIYAAGDVVGFPALASTSMLQGRIAVLHATGVEVTPPADLPLAIYTIPELSAVGLTEAQAREQGVPFEIGIARHAETPRGQILGDAEGLLKLIFHRDDRRVLGVHALGEQASETVHLGMWLVQHGGTLDQLAAAVFNYPTLAEAYRVAALDGLNRLS